MAYPQGPAPALPDRHGGALRVDAVKCADGCDACVPVCPTKAIAREKQLKHWGREKKIALVERANPAWVDLSRDWYDVEPADFRRATDRMLD